MVIWNEGHRPPESGRYLVTVRAMNSKGIHNRWMVCCADYTIWKGSAASWHCDLSGALVMAWAKLPEAWDDNKDKD